MEASDRARLCAEAIVDELTNRKGLRHEWDNIDPDIQGEITNTFAGIADTYLNAALEEAAGVREALEWFGKQRNLELYFYAPVYGDDDDLAEEWRVELKSGSINDREWETVGCGETPIAAIQAAQSALKAKG